MHIIRHLDISFKLKSKFHIFVKMHNPLLHVLTKFNLNSKNFSLYFPFF